MRLTVYVNDPIRNTIMGSISFGCDDIQSLIACAWMGFSYWARIRVFVGVELVLGTTSSPWMTLRATVAAWRCWYVTVAERNVPAGTAVGGARSLMRP